MREGLEMSNEWLSEGEESVEREEFFGVHEDFDDDPPVEDGPELKPIYVASRASVPERGEMWRKFRRQGIPISSSWIDEDGQNQTDDFGELWERITNEIKSSNAVVLYAEDDDFPLKGAFIEAGIALGLGVPVVVCLPNVTLTQSFRPIGSWIAHPLVSRVDDVEAAVNLALYTRAPVSSELKPDAPERIWLRKVERDGHENWTQCAGHDKGDVEFIRSDLARASVSPRGEVERGYWPTLLDRGDGVSDHYCIGRLIRTNEPYWEFWNQGQWVSAGEVFVGRENAQKALDRLRTIYDSPDRVRRLLAGQNIRLEQAEREVERLDAERDALKTEAKELRKVYSAAIDVVAHCRGLAHEKGILVTGVEDLDTTMKKYETARTALTNTGEENESGE
jgi:hypothetical protein